MKKVEVRSLHPYMFRTGQWAEVVGIEDSWPIEDQAARYEFRDAQEAE